MFDKKRNARIQFRRAIAPRPQGRRREPRRSHVHKVERIRVLEVVRRADGWALLVDDLDEPAFTVSTKAKATRAAKEAARFHRCRLRVFTAAGKLQSDHDFAAA